MNENNLPEIDELVIDEDGNKGRIVQIVEEGEVAIVDYSEFSALEEAEIEIWDLKKA
ncbi:hypothetical protein [Streptomyces phaeochromogenes]|uniref:hypothetical protein n=1 Tax=Streptomyces phaeochromogenes TaxID=1923 RepID=UPI0036B97992